MTREQSSCVLSSEFEQQFEETAAGSAVQPEATVWFGSDKLRLVCSAACTPVKAELGEFVRG